MLYIVIIYFVPLKFFLHVGKIQRKRMNTFEPTI